MRFWRVQQRLSCSMTQHSCKHSYILPGLGGIGVVTYRLQAANGGSDLRSSGINATQERALVVGQRVHGLERNVEARVGVVDRKHVDALPVVRQLPARPARGGVPARDRRRASDVREVRERAEGGEALGEQPVRAVGARDVREAGRAAVVRLVVGDRHGWRSRC